MSLFGEIIKATMRAPLAALSMALFALALTAVSGCGLLRSDSSAGDRGKLLLVFNTRSGCGRDLKRTRAALRNSGVRATFFIAGNINSALARQIDGILSEGHEVGLCGLRGANAKTGVPMFGAQKFYQDEVVTQILDGRRYGLHFRDFAAPYEHRSWDFSEFLRQKGFRQVLTLPEPSADFDPALLSRRHSYLMLMPTDFAALSRILATARSASIPFATISDLPVKK